MKFISPKIHGIIDYLMVIVLLCSPAFFGFTGTLAVFTYALGAVHLLLSILTDYPMGAFKAIPVTIHATIEVLVGIILIVLAYTLFGDNPDGKLFYVIFGTVILLTWLVTDYMGNEFNEATL
ncbi:hypothetical protein [Mucilaginibacter sp.]|uniref:hypothetical protein n=1 Tax=Mucilaginibacter sp. TaxID=1882438 RepID=UPI002844C59E|nr:hypothetical protein [Mucilaginibacter sp.]MDR3696915.1 hypothetical protein [Mucilaginibacter sp.]